MLKYKHLQLNYVVIYFTLTVRYHHKCRCGFSVTVALLHLTLKVPWSLQTSRGLKLKPPLSHTHTHTHRNILYLCPPSIFLTLSRTPSSLLKPIRGRLESTNACKTLLLTCMLTLAAHALSGKDSQGCRSVVRPRRVIERRGLKGDSEWAFIFANFWKPPVWKYCMKCVVPTENFLIWSWKTRTEAEEKGTHLWWLNRRSQFHQGDYWTPHACAHVVVISYTAVSCWQELLWVLDFPRIRVCFICRVSGSRKHVKWTSPSPVEGSLAAVALARWVQALSADVYGLSYRNPINTWIFVSNFTHLRNFLGKIWKINVFEKLRKLELLLVLQIASQNGVWHLRSLFLRMTLFGVNLVSLI